MYIWEENIAAIQQALMLAQRAGDSWVVFDDARNNIPKVKDLIFFDSYTNAEKVCDQLNLSFGFATRKPIPFYQCMPIENMKIQLAAINDTGRPSVDVDHLVKTYGNLHIRPTENWFEGQMHYAVSQGSFFPVELRRSIDPVKDIIAFHVVQHHHPGQQVYEVGHSHNVIGSFPVIEAASDFLVDIMKQPPEKHGITDDVLVGQFNNKTLILDMDGHPVPGSGVTFAAGNFEYDAIEQQKKYTWRDFRDDDGKKPVSQHLFARYDLAEKKINLYDDHLKEADPMSTYLNVYPDSFKRELVTIKLKIAMNQKNEERLLNQVKYAGFGETLHEEIKAKLSQNLPEFNVRHASKVGEDPVVAQLNFKKSDKSELYFFQNYDLSVKPANSPDMLEQSFRINNKGQNVTLKEAYNLMNGRAVHKELTNKESQVYKPWMMLDFKNTDEYGNYKMTMFYEKYNYNVGTALSKLPIKEMEAEPGKTNVVLSLQKGNVQEVTFQRNGQEEKFNVTANPVTRGINVYDAGMQLVDYKKVMDDKKELAEKNSVTLENSQKTGVEKENKEGVAKDEKKNVKKGVSI